MCYRRQSTFIRQCPSDASKLDVVIIRLSTDEEETIHKYIISILKLDDVRYT